MAKYYLVILWVISLSFSERQGRLPIYEKIEPNTYEREIEIIYLDPEKPVVVNVPEFERHPEPEPIHIPYPDYVPRKSYYDPKLLKELNGNTGNLFDEIDINRLTPEQYLSIMNSLK